MRRRAPRPGADRPAVHGRRGPGGAGRCGGAQLVDAVEQIPLADEARAGYSRDAFKHWNTGLDPADGCNTRAEVLQASGASAWTPARREAYANDQDASSSLVAMTARSNRQKADQDPRDWMPPLPSAHCRYISEWVGTKLRWNLAADNAEMDALAVFAHGDCAKTAVIFTPAP
ncbi:hypothetical protein [Streptomyces exfoliatus]|uniref:hypothetical protein n=1 Tax=Streptomyces exfoliatus TaxID=1905 RepID=UPI0006892803